MILSYIFQISKNAFAMFSACVIFLCYYFINKNSKLKEDNKTLSTDIEEMNIETEKIVTIQAKQMDIASRPAVSRDNILQWMRSRKISSD